MNWKPIYALLLLYTTIITFFLAKVIEKKIRKNEGHNNEVQKRKAKCWLTIGIVLCLVMLVLFKYYNFINETVFTILETLGIRWIVPNLDFLLPVGISFYTFIALGYIIDVYRGTVAVENNILKYALFVSFFPQLLAGPIARARSLMPQFDEDHYFELNRCIDSIKLMIWGYFMKLCIADRLLTYVDSVYNNIPQHTGTSFIIATIFFTIQIYCDFAGYSLIAIGAAKFMGFRLMDNFIRPYFSCSVKEFWKRWHISLSSWFMDYVYIPLGGNRCKYLRHLINLMITFLVSGIWHGANWTFVLWGGVHGVFICAENMLHRIFGKPEKEMKIWKKMPRMIVVFCLAAFAWMFFRANTIDDAYVIIAKMLSDHGPLFVDFESFLFGTGSILILLLKDAKDEFGWNIHFMHSNKRVVSFVSCVAMVCYILFFGALDGGSFIYFQF